jgi:antitoxin PrlF
MNESIYSKLTEDGQVTIPAEIITALQLKPGTRIAFINRGDSIVMTPINKSLKDLKGILPKPDRALSLEEIDELLGKR